MLVVNCVRTELSRWTVPPKDIIPLGLVEMREVDHD